MASSGSAKSRRSPGSSAPKSSATAEPTRACSREVRGSWMPCLPNTYLVKPEQSKPLCGVLPPHTYGPPTYLSAVSSTREASAVGAGERGIETPDDPLEPEGLPPPGREARAFASIASPISTAAEITCDGERPTIPWAQPPRNSSVDARAACVTRRGRDDM